MVTTTDTSGGILCKCVKEDGKMRIRVTSPGYNVYVPLSFFIIFNFAFVISILWISFNSTMLGP